MPSLLHQVRFPPDAGRTPLGSRPLTGTSAPPKVCLARASRPGCSRRCLFASRRVRLASSLYSLQGTLEKIHLQGAVGQGLFQPLDFVFQLLLSRHRLPDLLLPAELYVSPPV